MGPTAACLCGGGTAPEYPSGTPGKVEEYDGTSWTEVADLAKGRRTGGSAGSTSDALIFGGEGPPIPGRADQTESWNGTAWTELGDLATAVYAQMQGQGVNSASTAMSSGGNLPGPTGTVETWSIPDAIKTFTAT